MDAKDEYKSASAENAEDEEGSHEEAEEEEDEDDSKSHVQHHDSDHDGDDEEGDQVDEGHSFAYSNGNDYERIKALSEKQVEELHKKPGNCKHFAKDGMICAVCKDPDTGDTSEVT